MDEPSGTFDSQRINHQDGDEVNVIEMTSEVKNGHEYFENGSPHEAEKRDDCFQPESANELRSFIATGSVDSKLSRGIKHEQIGKDLSNNTASEGYAAAPGKEIKIPFDSSFSVTQLRDVAQDNQVQDDHHDQTAKEHSQEATNTSVQAHIVDKREPKFDDVLEPIVPSKIPKEATEFAHGLCSDSYSLTDLAKLFVPFQKLLEPESLSQGGSYPVTNVEEKIGAENNMHVKGQQLTCIEEQKIDNIVPRKGEIVYVDKRGVKHEVTLNY
ncbi:hypothetical protein PFISCL1PPCAC_9088, partial [Pristionchus fissidentatus]